MKQPLFNSAFIILTILALSGCADPRRQEARTQVQVLRTALHATQTAQRDHEQQLVQQVLERAHACQQERWRAAVLDTRVQVLLRIEGRRVDLHRMVETSLDAVAKPELERLHERLTAAQAKAGQGDSGAVRETENLKAAMAASLATVKKYQIELGEQVDQGLVDLRNELMTILDQRRDHPPEALGNFKPEELARAITADQGDGAGNGKGLDDGLNALDTYLQSPTGFALVVDGLMPRNQLFDRWRGQLDQTVARLQGAVGERIASELGSQLEHLGTRLAAVTLPRSLSPNRKEP